MARLTVVVPCYNEAERLDAAPLLAFIDGHADTSFLLVNDGSRDGTAACSTAWPPSGRGGIRALQLAPNRGKAEAVREGLRAALAAGADIVGFLDADLSTPPAEIDDLLRRARPPGGAGRDRGAHRHARLRHRPQRGSPLPRPRVRDRGVADPAGPRLRHPVRREAVPRGPGAVGRAVGAVLVALGVRRRIPRPPADRVTRPCHPCR